MCIIERHNTLRQREGLFPLTEHTILNDHAYKASKWMARRNWGVYWNFDTTRKILISQGFKDIEYNLTWGEDEEKCFNHLLHQVDKRTKIYGDYKYIGIGVYATKYPYWTILYGN